MLRSSLHLESKMYSKSVFCIPRKCIDNFIRNTIAVKCFDFYDFFENRREIR